MGFLGTGGIGGVEQYMDRNVETLSYWSKNRNFRGETP